MNTADFAKTIRQKYPTGVASDGRSYADMDDQELVNKVVQKYPVYKNQINDFKGDGAINEFVNDVSSSVKERVGTIGEEITEDENSLGRKALRTGGQVGGLVGDLEMSVLKLITPKFAEDLVSKGVEKISKTEFAQTVMTKLDEFKQKYPEASQDLEDVVNIAALIPYIKGAETAVKGGQKAIQTVSKVTDKVSDVTRATRIANASDEIDDVVRRLVQGDKKDLIKAKRALSNINLEGVNTPTELGELMDDGIEAMAKKVDDIFEAEGAKIGSLKTNQLVTATKVGEKTVKQNFVQEALDQMEDVYKIIKDAPAQAEIVALKKKLTTEGLTLKEVNEIAKRYGSQIKDKAFSKKGDALTSLNAQAYENTRKGIKNIVRGLVPDDVARDTATMLDRNMSDLYNTRRLVKNVEDKAYKLFQRVDKRGIIEKVSMKLADVVDVVTFKSASGFISRLLPSNVGNKTKNFLRISEEYGKYLKKLNKLQKITDDSALVEQIVNMVRNSKP